MLTAIKIASSMESRCGGRREGSEDFIKHLSEAGSVKGAHQLILECHGNFASFFRNNNDQSITFAGNALRRAVSRAKVLPLGFGQRQNAGRSGDSATADDHGSIVKGGLGIKNIHEQLA